MAFKKHDCGKPPIHYLGQFYPALGKVATRLAEGHAKYGSNDNWKRCDNLTRYTDALGRHYLQYAGGCRDEDHLAAIVCNALFLMELSNNPTSAGPEPSASDAHSHP